MGVWGMVRGLTAMWELKASKVSSSVIVTVWLAQIGRAAVSAWLPCSSPHHGTEQPCTSAPTHRTRSGTHTVLGSHRFAHADTRARLRLFGQRTRRLDYKLRLSTSTKQIFKCVQRLEMSRLLMLLVTKNIYLSLQTTKWKKPKQSCHSCLSNCSSLFTVTTERFDYF